MRVLVIGGSGYVASLFLPHVARRHGIRVLDRVPGDGRYEQVTGDATDPAQLAAAMEGVDAVIHCAMGSPWLTGVQQAADAFDVNVKSVYLALQAAQGAGVRHAVHISSMSVYHQLTSRRLDESTPPDARDPYGLTKRLGEQVCAAAAAEWGMSINMLRIAWPTPDEVWPRWQPPWDSGEPKTLRAGDGTPIQGTSATDLAAAILAALEYRDGCQAFIITGDRSARIWSIEKAGRLLGWSPTTDTAL